MFKLSRKNSLKVLSVIGTLIIALSIAVPALADHALYWHPTGFSCDPASNTITIFGYADGPSGNDSTEEASTWTQVDVNGSFVGSSNDSITVPGSVTGPYPKYGSTTFTDPSIVEGAFIEVYSGNDFSHYASGICGVGGGACGDDGRINTNCAAPVITYCDTETLKFYKLDADGEGSLLFTYDIADVPTSGNADKLLKQVGKVKLYWRHEDGLLKLLAPQTDGKIYYMLLDPTTCISQREGAEWGLK